MAYVVTRLCRDCTDTACVSVCPVDCFYQPKQTSDSRPNQLYISPDECIDCGACVPECPWEAIYESEDVPDIFKDDADVNALSDAERDSFETAKHLDKGSPDPEQVLANKRKWGMKV
jgi:ferredoxin